MYSINSFSVPLKQIHFANPVYESMYAGAATELVTASGSGGSGGMSASAPDERKGLLHYPHHHDDDAPHGTDLL